MEKCKAIKKVDCISRTHFPGYIYKFKWILENFSELNYVTSQTFSAKKGTLWYLYISKFENKINSLKIYREKGQEDENVTYEFYIVLCNGEELIHTRSTAYFSKSISGNVLINDLSIKKEDLKKCNDVVELILILELPHKEVTEQYDPLQYYFPPENEFELDVYKSMSQDLEKLYQSQMNTDVTLSIEGDTLKVHKAILSARSVVFANMFQQEMVESTNNVVVIEDVKMSAMKEVVAFMYGRAKRDYDYDTALEVYYIADKYDVKKLKEVCGAVMASQLNEKNAGKILNAADRHQDKMLKERVMNFIIANLKSCAITEWWGVLMSSKSEVAAEVATFITQFK